MFLEYPPDHLRPARRVLLLPGFGIDGIGHGLGHADHDGDGVGTALQAGPFGLLRMFL